MYNTAYCTEQHLPQSPTSLTAPTPYMHPHHPLSPMMPWQHLFMMPFSVGYPPFSMSHLGSPQPSAPVVLHNTVTVRTQHDSATDISPEHTTAINAASHADTQAENHTQAEVAQATENRFMASVIQAVDVQSRAEAMQTVSVQSHAQAIQTDSRQQDSVAWRTQSLLTTLLFGSLSWIASHKIKAFMLGYGIAWISIAFSRINLANSLRWAHWNPAISCSCTRLTPCIHQQQALFAALYAQYCNARNPLDIHYAPTQFLREIDREVFLLRWHYVITSLLCKLPFALFFPISKKYLRTTHKLLQRIQEIKKIFYTRIARHHIAMSNLDSCYPMKQSHEGTSTT